MKEFCEDAESASEAARPHKLLVKDPINPLGILQKPAEDFTNTRKGILEVLLQRHCPDSEVSSENADDQQKSQNHPQRTKWKLLGVG